jgi:lysophospholipase L1-like esterase
LVTIVVFGDSNTYGCWDSECGWVTRLRKHLERKDKHEYSVYNLGISGDSTTEILKRFRSECNARYREAKEYKEKFVILIATGSNDSYYLHDKKRNKTTKPRFRRNYQKLIELSREFTDKVLCIGPFYCDETRSSPIPWNSNISYRNKYKVAYNEIAKEICSQDWIPFVDLIDSGKATDYVRFLDDGVHLNTDGHAMVFEKVKGILERSGFIS